MYTYRIVLDAFNSRSSARGARVVTYASGYTRADAMSKIKTINIGPDGTVSDDRPWPGSNNLPKGNIAPRSLPEWTRVSIRSVVKRGTPRIIWETESV